LSPSVARAFIPSTVGVGHSGGKLSEGLVAFPGEEPEALAEVGGANVGRAETTPARIEPEAGKVSEDSGKTSEPNKSGDVLHEQVARSQLAQALSGDGPQPPITVNAPPETGGGEVGTGESGGDEIHSATKRRWVEGLDRRPDRSAIQGLVSHPRHEDARGIGLPFDVAHAAAFESHQLEGELEASVAGEQMEHAQGSQYHVTPPSNVHARRAQPRTPDSGRDRQRSALA
jgi:hypothetical protein